MINEGISIVGISEGNINWSKILIKENIYIIGLMGGLKRGGLLQDIIGSPFPRDHFKVEAQISRQ